jgi:hypothetical protein
VKDQSGIQATHKDQLINMVVLARMIFATEMKDKVYVGYAITRLELMEPKILPENR